MADNFVSEQMNYPVVFKGMTKFEIRKLTEKYVGMSCGFLGTFKSHVDLSNFYLDCDIDIDSRDYEGTNAQRFVKILENSLPKIQAKIIQGILERHPVESAKHRTPELHHELMAIIKRLRS